MLRPSCRPPAGGAAAGDGGRIASRTDEAVDSRAGATGRAVEAVHVLRLDVTGGRAQGCQQRIELALDIAQRLAAGAQGVTQTGSAAERGLARGQA